MKALVRPPRLAPGARVAVVATSGPVPKDRLQAGFNVLRGWGLDTVPGRHVLAQHREFGYLAGTDADRAADLQNAWCDPTVDAVLCARGGYGAQRLVDLLDWDAMRAAGPKIFVGFSDATVLHEAFATRLGLTTLYGPMAAGIDFIETTRAQQHLRATLFTPETVRTIASGGTPLVPGRARGVTLGGCLCLLAAERGTPHTRPSAGGGLLCLEDVGEETYRLDRYLTQLLRSGWLEGVHGVLLGSWQECADYAEVRPLLADRLGTLGVPVVEDFGFGHCEGALTIPFGVAAELDADGATLTLDWPALR
ncbi:LD-carboxypeptidase [Streptomyces pluripotens]|uniref:LD-carboxypeptidase n=1 Tax=Streptomyces pluripotens TaxID=1355015 RepID=A0A221P5Y5_9ACTN|nr:MULTISPECIES: LD-carboxypeptidase [Streptomyces]ARP73168.1 LD-carboxypeptidase [Streptomyces pluripotens]ASN27418.1 LD-carboxypeptidase [Streptomyces pluripotens]MCH0558057.1 LD-carboxypeptidase [Streptomyces sp. MUM 16J]